MGVEIFTLHELPDLTMAQYSAEESGGVEDIIRQHASFYRQLNRKGLLFEETYHLIYLYVPRNQPGKRIQMYFRADHYGSQDGPACMEQFLDAVLLSNYFHFKKVKPEVNPVFRYQAELVKQDGFVSSSLTDREMEYYVVSPWKPNEKARLMGLFRMLQKLDQPAAYVVSMQPVDRSETMQDAFRQQMQYIRNVQKQNKGIRDENAEQCLKSYDKLFESLRSNPHFRCRISAFAAHPDLAKMILDAAASEAVEEGNYRIVSKEGKFYPLVPEKEIPCMCAGKTPRGMREWNSLFLLKELVPFAMFPTLYPGENIELPKESAPVYEKTGLYLGVDNYGYDVYFPLSLLPKHALLAGVPGSGKTYSMLHLASQLAGSANNIPILVLEPAKKEYRALAHNTDIPDLIVFSPGSTGSFPLRINPFEFPVGLKLSEHITALNQVFMGAFDLEAPMPFLVSEAIDQVYQDHGWHWTDVNEGKATDTYPTTHELYDKIAKLLDASSYAPEVKSNLKSVLQVRIGSLITREMGNVFDVPASTLAPEEWLRTKCVVELESLGPDAANFLTLLLLTLIRELLRQNPKADKEKPRHVIFLEEAHNLIGPSTVANAENGNAKVASTQYIVDMLAEVRALREAIVIADQLPTALAPQVTKNTSLKIGHRITAMDDRELLASTMSADGVQLERMALFQPGHALCLYENVQKPFEVQIAEYGANSDSPDNEGLFRLLRDRPVYFEIMTRDREIMEQKFEKMYAIVLKLVREVIEGENCLNRNAEQLITQEALGEEIPDTTIKKIEHDMETQQWKVWFLAQKNRDYLKEYIEYYKMNKICMLSPGVHNVDLKVQAFMELYEKYLDPQDSREPIPNFREKLEDIRRQVEEKKDSFDKSVRQYQNFYKD